MNLQNLAAIEHLACATRHVLEGEHLVAKQKALISQLKQDGQPTEAAEWLLKLLEGVLQDMIEYRERCKTEIVPEL